MNWKHLVELWESEDFNPALKSTIEALDGSSLPLQQGLERSSVAADEGHTAVILTTENRGPELTATVGLFYSGLIAGCACDDDPTPQESIPEYCEIRVTIARDSGAASVRLLSD